MITKIRTAEEYKQVIQIIEGYIAKATEGGGFQSLSDAEAEELKKLSLLAEAWEDSIPLMPIRQQLFSGKVVINQVMKC